jgi:iron(III) transport system substrate-binding protein
VRVKPRHPKLSLLLATCLALTAAACGDDDGSTATTAASAAGDTTAASAAGGDTTAASAAGGDTTAASAAGGDTTAASAAGGDTTAASAAAAGAYDELIAAAQDEGKITVYSSQGLDQLNALADAFKAKYDGIDVEVVRGTDGDLIPRIDTELQTGNGGSDLVVVAAAVWAETTAAAGNFLEPASPQLTGEGEYDAALYVHDDNRFEVGAAVLTFGWNTELYPAGLTDYPDMLDPELSGGKIGVVDPASGPAIVDFYLFLEETYGADFVDDLAAQEPRIYPSSLPMGEALQSGEIFAGTFVAPVQLVPAKASGAPVDFGIAPEGAWGARYYAGIPKTSPHPNAAQLFADFMVTAEGQELVQGASGSVLPDIPGTLITVDKVRVLDPVGQQPENLAAYTERWNGLFR